MVKVRSSVATEEDGVQHDNVHSLAAGDWVAHFIVIVGKVPEKKQQTGYVYMKTNPLKNILVSSCSMQGTQREITSQTD